MKLHKYIKELIKKNRQEVALRLLQEKVTDSQDETDIILIVSKWNNMKRNQKTGRWDDDKCEQKQIEISDSILYCLDLVPDMPLEKEIQQLEEDKFLCVAHSPESHAFLENFFNFPPFKLFDVCHLEEYQQFMAENKYIFAVFDNNDGNTDKEKLKEREALMAECLEAMNCPILIHYGSQFIDLVRLQPNRVVSANSVFTLHSRVKDVLSYLGLNLQQI
jgi:hypothetical protein